MPIGLWVLHPKTALSWGTQSNVDWRPIFHPHQGRCPHSSHRCWMCWSTMLPECWRVDQKCGWCRVDVLHRCGPAFLSKIISFLLFIYFLYMSKQSAMSPIFFLSTLASSETLLLLFNMKSYIQSTGWHIFDVSSLYLFCENYWAYSASKIKHQKKYSTIRHEVCR